MHGEQCCFCRGIPMQSFAGFCMWPVFLAAVLKFSFAKWPFSSSLPPVWCFNRKMVSPRFYRRVIPKHFQPEQSLNYHLFWENFKEDLLGRISILIDCATVRWERSRGSEWSTSFGLVWNWCYFRFQIIWWVLYLVIQKFVPSKNNSPRDRLMTNISVDRYIGVSFD